MGQETEIDLNISDDSNISAIGEPDNFSSDRPSEDQIKSVLDERDYIPPIEDAGERAAAAAGDDLPVFVGEPEESLAPDQSDEEDRPGAPETEVPLSTEDETGTVDLADGNPETEPTGETLNAGESAALQNSAAEGKPAPAETAGSNSDLPNGDADEDLSDISTEALPGATSTASSVKSAPRTAVEQPDGSDDNDIVGLEDDGDDLQSETATTESLPTPKAELARAAGNAPVKTGAEKPAAARKVEKPADLQRSAARKDQLPGHHGALANKLSSIVVVLLVAAGAVLYMNPSLIGLSRMSQPMVPARDEAPLVVEPVQQPPSVSPAPSKREQCQARLDEAVELRRLLLEKKNEIYQLDLYYRSGNAAMEAEILQEIERSGIATFQAAIENKRIELTLRTIQRRQAYIEELKKPAHWLNSGSEELYYLIRRAELDMQLAEVAGGIDLNRHVRHISAAIQKYRPGPDKLAIDPLKTELKPLEKIWEQVGQSKNTAARKNDSPQNELITHQICNGNYARIAELTHVTPEGAACLARMTGSDLFLNGITSLSVDAARRLAQWQGNWICLNGLQKMSEATAQYLFKWKGNWISLNSLTAFPPEFAKHLLKWEGQQLELMGLEYGGTKDEQKMLKYLALWETTTGGKLFVPDNIRQELKQLM